MRLILNGIAVSEARWTAGLLVGFLFEDFSAPNGLYFIILGDRQKTGRTRFDKCGKPSGKSAERG